ncbi:MAG TPA: ankyrin repeat domain-containing protein, partial [Planctomycetaceae bacterium]
IDKPEIAELLIRAGADPNARQGRFVLGCGSGEEDTPSQNTPLHFAAARGNPQTIKVLLAGGADLEARNCYGYTPLRSTVDPPLYTGIDEASQLKNVEALLAAGATIISRDDKGQTVLDAAISSLESRQLRKDSEAEQKNDLERLQALVDLLKRHGAQPGEPQPKKDR